MSRGNKLHAAGPECEKTPLPFMCCTFILVFTHLLILTMISVADEACSYLQTGEVTLLVATISRQQKVGYLDFDTVPVKILTRDVQ